MWVCWVCTLQLSYFLQKHESNEFSYEHDPACLHVLFNYCSYFCLLCVCTRLVKTVLLNMFLMLGYQDLHSCSCCLILSWYLLLGLVQVLPIFMPIHWIIICTHEKVNPLCHIITDLYTIICISHVSNFNEYILIVVFFYQKQYFNCCL